MIAFLRGGGEMSAVDESFLGVGNERTMDRIPLETESKRK
jgi:hypothetical protein